ncbi:MAG: ribbon-helix-helix domain-containing protein [archaeon]|nr:ribbon-helix-helix domain-containing protein [archaeon]
MGVIEAKLTPKLLEEVEKLIKEGLYADRDEAIRDAIRRLIREIRYTKEEENLLKDAEWELYGMRRF